MTGRYAHLTIKIEGEDGAESVLVAEKIMNPELKVVAVEPPAISEFGSFLRGDIERVEFSFSPLQNESGTFYTITEKRPGSPVPDRRI